MTDVGNGAKQLVVRHIDGVNAHEAALLPIRDVERYQALPVFQTRGCVVLLEDIDAIGTDRQGSDKLGKKELSLSGLLNTLDGVASQEGRILIMTTNHIENLDEALIRPGRIDMKLEIPLADSEATKDLFSFVFRPDTQHDAVDDKELLELSRLAGNFAKKVPELKFSTAQIMSYLLKHKNSAEDALKGANDWFGVAPSEKQVKSGDRKSKESLETPQHSENGLWMENGSREKPTENRIKRTKKFPDLKLIIPASPPPSSYASTSPLSAVGESVVHTTSGPPNAGAGTEPDIVVQDHCSKTDCNLNPQIWDTDKYFPLDHGARKMTEDDRHEVGIQGWGQEKPSSAYTTLAPVSGSHNRSRLLETEPKGGNGARQQPRMTRNTITVTTSIAQVITPNTGVVENSKFQAEIKAIPPSNAGNTHTVSCLTPMSTTSGDNRAASTQSKTQSGVAQLKPLPMNADGPDKMELPEPYPLFNSDRDDLPQDNTTPTVRGSEALPGSCNIGQLSIHELDTSLSDLFDQTKDYGGTDTNDCLPPISEFVSEHDTEETTANNNTQPETGSSSSATVKDSSFSTPPLSAVGAPVPKICTPSSAKTDVQVELVVEVEKPRDDSEAEDVTDIGGIDVDFDLNCGARRITEEDFVRLGLHNLSWAKLRDATTGLPSLSTEDLRGLKNASKDRPFLVGGANARDGSEENVAANKTEIDIGDSKLSVANANSRRRMEFVPPIDHSGSQDSSGDGLPGCSPKWQLPKADDVPQTIDSAKTPNVTNSDRADESVWVKVEMDTDNLPTQTDTVEVK